MNPLRKMYKPYNWQFTVHVHCKWQLEIVLTALYEHGCRAIFSNAVYAVLFMSIMIINFAPKKVKFRFLCKNKF